jgi:hypothetical protein
MTFVRNHARVIVACDFAVAVTLRFRILYVLIVMEVGSRKILHVNVTPHPTPRPRGRCSSSAKRFLAIMNAVG